MPNNNLEPRRGYTTQSNLSTAEVVFGQSQVEIVPTRLGSGQEVITDRLGAVTASTPQMSSDSDLMEEALDQSRKLNSSYRKKLDILRKKLATREERIAALEGQVKTLTEELEAIANEVGGI